MDETPANHGIFTISTHVFPQDFQDPRLAFGSFPDTLWRWALGMVGEKHVSLFRWYGCFQEWGYPSKSIQQSKLNRPLKSIQVTFSSEITVQCLLSKQIYIYIQVWFSKIQMLHVWYVSFYLHWVKRHLHLCVNAGNRCHSIHPAMQQYFHPAWMSGATFGSTKPSRKTKPQSVFPKKIHCSGSVISGTKILWFFTRQVWTFSWFFLWLLGSSRWWNLGRCPPKVPGALLNTLACVKTSKAMSASRALWSKFVEVLWCFILYALKSHRIHVWHIYLHLVYFMVNVGKYTIHGSYGNS